MGYLISLSGAGVSAEDAQRVFEDAVRALRLVTREGAGPVEGGLGLADPDGPLTNDHPVRHLVTMSAVDVDSLT